MRELCDFLEITSDYFEDYNFKRINVTYESKMKWLHKLAVNLNSRSERFLRQRPNLKQFIVSLYKKVNQAREGYNDMSEESHYRLKEYYKPSIDALQTLIGTRKTPWDI